MVVSVLDLRQICQKKGIFPIFKIVTLFIDCLTSFPCRLQSGYNKGVIHPEKSP
jgi:hypothetical protein